MDLTTRKVDDIFVINVDGDIDSDTSSMFKKSLNYALGRGERNILLNFENVNFITSVGIGVIIDLYKQLDKNNGKLVLVKVRKLVRDVLEVSRLDSVFQIMDTESEAIRSMSES